VETKRGNGFAAGRQGDGHRVAQSEIDVGLARYADLQDCAGLEAAELDVRELGRSRRRTPIDVTASQGTVMSTVVP
jgi:hypothetical protein